MSLRSVYYRRAVRVLSEALAELAPPLTRIQVVRACRAAYPFGERKRWPYKKWCDAQRDMLALKFPQWFKPRRRRRRPTAAAVAEGPGLFDSWK